MTNYFFFILNNIQIYYNIKLHMDRLIKIKSEGGSVEETINNEDNIEMIKKKLKDKEDMPIKEQRLVFKIIEENRDYKEIN